VLKVLEVLEVLAALCVFTFRSYDCLSAGA